jgi:hypothetical protein
LFVQELDDLAVGLTGPAVLLGRRRDDLFGFVNEDGGEYLVTSYIIREHLSAGVAPVVEFIQWRLVKIDSEKQQHSYETLF